MEGTSELQFWLVSCKKANDPVSVTRLVCLTLSLSQQEQFQSTWSSKVASQQQRKRMHTVIKIALLLTSYVAYITGTEETHTKCVSAFVGYTPSPFERKWTQHVKEWQSTVCQHITNDEMTWWIGNTTAAYKDNEGSVVFTDSVIPPKAEWTEVLSVFTYKKSCVHKTDGNTVVQFAHIPIEPTAALARDPRKCWNPMSENYVQSKEYLVPLSYKAATVSAMHTYNPHKTAAEQGSRAFLFDAGATVAGQQSKANNRNNWSGTGWIFDWYAARGIVFDEIHAWEPTKTIVDPKNLEPTLAKALHFYNVGITAGPNDRNNPLARIRELCKPKDIVVFKLDIDNAMEMRVVQQLLADDDLMGLVDDFYFEHHVRNDVMKMHGLGARNDPSTDLNSWYEMVLPARRKGLHMHFWP